MCHILYSSKNAARRMVEPEPSLNLQGSPITLNTGGFLNAGAVHGGVVVGVLLDGIAIAENLPGDGGIGFAESRRDLMQGLVVFKLLLDK